MKNIFNMLAVATLITTAVTLVRANHTVLVNNYCDGELDFRINDNSAQNGQTNATSSGPLWGSASVGGGEAVNYTLANQGDPAFKSADQSGPLAVIQVPQYPNTDDVVVSFQNDECTSYSLCPASVDAEWPNCNGQISCDVDNASIVISFCLNA